MYRKINDFFSQPERFSFLLICQKKNKPFVIQHSRPMY